MIRWKRLLCLFCMLLLSISQFSCKSNSPEDIQKDFHSFLDDIFIDEITSDSISLHYTLADPEAYGIKNFKPTLGQYSSKQMKKDLVSTENLKMRLLKFPYEILSDQDQITYDILMDSIDKTLQCGAYPYLAEHLSPSTGLQAQLPILLAEYTFYSKKDIDAYIKLLYCIDDYFSMICSYEQEKSNQGYFMSDEVADQIIAQCNDFICNPEENFLITYFNQKLKENTDLTKKERILYEEENRNAVLTSVIPGYEKIIKTLTNLKGSCINHNGLCGFTNGKEYYQLVAQATTGSSKTIPQMKLALKSALNQSFAVLTTLGIQDPTLYSQYQNIQFPSDEPIEIMRYLEDAISTDFPAIQPVNYSVKYVHESLQEHLSPAMYIIPPLDDYTNHNIYINNTPIYDMTKIFPTVAHEGYPGHLYQNVYLRQLDFHPIRSIIDVCGYDEGWATYVECYSYSLAGLNDALVQFLQANMIAVHCLYSLTDIGIHYDGWSKEDTIRFWSNYVLSESDAEAIYYGILAEPGIYLPYSIGYLELLELKATAQENLQDKFNTKDFHQFILDFGPAPFDIIKRHMEESFLRQDFLTE